VLLVSALHKKNQKKEKRELEMEERIKRGDEKKKRDGHGLVRNEEMKE
jgi:hypothetical protein